MTEAQWLEERYSGIGASEAAAVMGMSPHTSNERLWEIKTRRATPPDISASPFVKYGKAAEPYLIELFALDFPEYTTHYESFQIIRNPDYPFIFATLDGELRDRAGNEGVLEIKTTEIMNPGQWAQWDGRIPQHYYIQVLHQLLATGYTFAILKAQIRYRTGGDLNITTRHYRINRSDVTEDMDALLKEEIAFWECVTQDRRPNIKLPPI